MVPRYLFFQQFGHLTLLTEVLYEMYEIYRFCFLRNEHLLFFCPQIVLFKYSCVFKKFGFTNCPCGGKLFGTWTLQLYEDIPMFTKFTTSNTDKLSTNLYLSCTGTQSAL